MPTRFDALKRRLPPPRLLIAIVVVVAALGASVVAIAGIVRRISAPNMTPAANANSA